VVILRRAVLAVILRRAEHKRSCPGGHPAVTGLVGVILRRAERKRSRR
jgi:hypothetical protein